MALSESSFSVDADLLYERGPDHHDEKLTAIDVLDEFLCNVGRLAKFVEPCKIKISPKVSIEITSVLSHQGIECQLPWGDIRQVFALAPSHPRYNNVVSVWSSKKIYLFHLKSQQAGSFAAYLNATQLPASSLYDSQKETDIAMLKKCFEELEKFVAEEVTSTKKQLEELAKLDDTILQLNGKKKLSRCRRFVALCCCCVGAALPTLERCVLSRCTIVSAVTAKRQKVVDALETVRHAYLIFTRVAPTLQRIGYCSSQAEFGRKITAHFAGVVFCAKAVAALASESSASVPPKKRHLLGPSTKSLDTGDKDNDKYSLVASVNSPPLTEAALKTIETYLPDRPELASDWPYFGPNWTLSIHEQEMDWNDWGIASQQQLKELNRDVEMLRSTLRRSYQQLVERRLVAEVEHAKRQLHERLKEIEQQKQALAEGIPAGMENDFLMEKCLLPPARMNVPVQRAFVAEIKKHNGRAVVVTQPGEIEAHGAFKVCDKESLEILEELNGGTFYRVRNADGIIGSVPESAVVEIKL